MSLGLKCMTCKDSLGRARQPHGVPGRASSFPLPFAPFWSLPWGSRLAGIDADSMPFSPKAMISHLSPPHSNTVQQAFSAPRRVISNFHAGAYSLSRECEMAPVSSFFHDNVEHRG